MPIDPDHSPLLPGDRRDARTAANTHPPDWQNPSPAKRYDLVILGAGTAGLVSAGTASLLGAKVAMVERAYTGGDCLISGCVPSKALLACARKAAEARDAARFGVETGAVDVDFTRAMEFMREARSRISAADAARKFSANYGVDLFFGDAKFIGPETAEVASAALRFRRAVIATGSAPATPDIPGLAETGFLTNETIFNLTERPARLAVIGGGPLGCELAQGFCRLGSRVTLIEHHDTFLHREDPDAATVLLGALRREGIVVRLGTKVTRVSRNGACKRLHLGDDVLDVDAVLVGVGRSPNVAGLGLDAAGVTFDGHGVHVDDFLRTSNRRIFAAGDVCLKQKFTHAADASARLAVQNALLVPTKRWSRQIVPRVTYTDPELAQLGSAAGGASKNHKMRTYTVSFDEIDRAVTDGATEGFLKVHVGARSGKIVSATIVGPYAGELLPTLTAARVAGRKLSSLANVIVPYPTRSDAIKKAADAAMQDELRGWKLRLARWWVGL